MRSLRFFVSAVPVLAALLVGACGGGIEGEGGIGPSQAPRDSGLDAKTDGGRRPPPPGDSGPNGDPDPYVEPTCPNPPPPKNDFQCDVTAQTGCKPGEGCYPYVDYPSGYCEPERYGSLCSLAGTGTQGTPCGGELCAAGFVCVITGAGTQCAKNCDLKKSAQCPEGLICEPLDVSGLGVCN